MNLHILRGLIESRIFEIVLIVFVQILLVPIAVGGLWEKINQVLLMPCFLLQQKSLY